MPKLELATMPVKTEVAVETESPRSAAERLSKLGFMAAGYKITRALSLTEKLKIAYEHFRYASVEKVKQFNDRLMKETLKEDDRTRSYHRTKLTAIQHYQEVPPASVLDALEAAQERGCFDDFAVMTIEEVNEQKRVPDPILFGTIVDCTDLFYIAQWDDDVKIEDILKDHEGWKFLEK